MSLLAPGTCRHCGCTEEDACRLENGEACCWADASRLVCSAPRCIVAEQERLRKAAQERGEQPLRPRAYPPCDCSVCSGRSGGMCRRKLANAIRKGKKRRAA